MDYLKHSKIEAQNESRLFHNSRRIIKFLLPFSLFYALIPLLPLLLQSLKPFFMQFYSYTIDKTYMFLLCNGLLVFIVKNSGLVDVSSPSTDQSKELHMENPESGRAELKESQGEEPVLCENDVEIECPEEDKSLAIAGGQDDGDDEEVRVLDAQEEHDAEETEELNKKCEDFIRKMKAAFYSEPRLHCNSGSDYQIALLAVECG